MRHKTKNLKNQTNILQRRKEAFLREILSEALAQMDDDRLNGLEVLGVECSRGRYDARILINASDMDVARQGEVERAFKGARSALSEYVLCASSWHSVPHFKLVFDDTLGVQNRLDGIFREIKGQK